MPLTVIATPGAADANAYLDLATADAYFESRLHAEVWTAASTADKHKALVMASRLIDTMVRWSGSVASSTQALQWPRYGMVYASGYAILSTVLPQALKQATAELALKLLSGDVTLDSDIDVQGITSLTAGPVSLSFKDTVTAKVIADAVYYLVAQWGSVVSRSAFGAVRLERV